jgi:hypothetical protein
MGHVDYKGIQFVKGMILVNEERREFIVSAVTSRIVVIVNTNNVFVESVSHSFASLKYKVKA